MKWLLACLGIVLALLPAGVWAAAYVDILATGNDPLDVPGPPVSFDAVAVSNYQVDITWTKGTYATTTIVKGKVGEYPQNIGDGYEVYNGNGENVTDWLDISLLDGNVYYRAWSHNDVGYSLTYAEDFVVGGGVGMAQALILIPIVLIALGLTVAGYFRQDRGWPIVLAAIIPWLALPVWGFTQAASATDVYALVGYVGIVMILICAFEPIIMKQSKPEPGLNEMWEEREERMLGPRRKRRYED